MGRPSEPVWVIPAKGSGRQERSRNTSIGITASLLRPHLKTPSCGRGWKVRLPKAENSKPDAETSSAWQQDWVLVFLSSRTWFGISVLGFNAPPCGRGSLLFSSLWVIGPLEQMKQRHKDGTARRQDDAKKKLIFLNGGYEDGKWYLMKKLLPRRLLIDTSRN
jgi:hypothetical protein